jgi:hypothetical protein
MKSKSLASDVLSTRCSHRTASGRQCRQLSANSQSLLCTNHLARQQQKEVDDMSRALLARSQNFQTAQGINFALANIYRLLAANRISSRRASVLAFINSLLLRTLPAIDADNEAGITDPTGPDPEEAPDTDEEASLEAAAESEPNDEPESASPKANSPEIAAEHSGASTSNAPTTHDPAPPSKYRSYRATIPDPTKKPS